MSTAEEHEHEQQSFWERHEFKFYKYGHIYAAIYGQVVIDYVPHQPLRRGLKALLIAYSHVLSLLLILVLPGYFVYHFRTLTETHDRRMQLMLYVSFANTAIKYATVIVTYVANTVHFEAINYRCTVQRQRLETAFQGAPRQPKRSFEFFMYFKFCLINLMMIVQVGGIFAVYSAADGPVVSQVRLHFAIYAFVLWNYTENMADYFYFINGSALKYYRQLHVQLMELRQQLVALRPGGMLMEHCCRMSDRLEELRQRFGEIHHLYAESLQMHQFQLLGLVLSTLINNLTNFYAIFNMLAKQSLEEISIPIVIGSVYATGFYIDTYIVTLLNEHIKQELEGLALTMRTFTEPPATVEQRLTQEIEQFSLQLLKCRPPMLCGLLNFDRRLVYLIAATAFSYFITLVQFDLYLRKRS